MNTNRASLVNWLSDEQWIEMPRPERALHVAAQEADVHKVREVAGNNRGERVERYLRAIGLGPGNPWCAAFVSWCLIKAGFVLSDLPAGPGAVRNWVDAATTGGPRVRLLSAPQRGCLFAWLNANRTGHIGFVAQVLPLGFVRTIEGNTSSGEAGSQRDGDGVYRRIRRAKGLTFLEVLP